MTQLVYPMILPSPTVPGAIPCFRLATGDGKPPCRSARRRAVWDLRCRRILERACSEDQRSNADVALLIEAETGMRFSESVLARHRAALGYGRARPNEWTAARPKGIAQLGHWGSRCRPDLMFRARKEQEP